MLNNEIINNAKKENRNRLTIDEVRQFKGYETVSDEQATDISNSLYQLSIIVYSILKQPHHEYTGKISKVCKEERSSLNA